MSRLASTENPECQVRALGDVVASWNRQLMVRGVPCRAQAAECGCVASAAIDERDLFSAMVEGGPELPELVLRGVRGVLEEQAHLAAGQGRRELVGSRSSEDAPAISGCRAHGASSVRIEVKRE